jgi:hypothetical protein
MATSRRKIRVLFLGQCLQSGYEGVPLPATYTSLARAALSTRFPELDFHFELRMLFHPKGLKALLRYRLAAFRPDIVVITALATFTATQWRTGILYEIAPEIVVTARSFVQRLDARFRSGLAFRHLLNKTLDKTLSLRPHVVHPPLKLDEYERLLEDGVNYCRRTRSRRVVLMGPGGFNEDTRMEFALQSPKLWSSVNQMVLSLGKRLNVPVINAQEALHEYSGEMYLPNEHKFSLQGQGVVAREVEAVLTDQVIGLLHSNDDGLTETPETANSPIVSYLDS